MLLNDVLRRVAAIPACRGSLSHCLVAALSALTPAQTRDVPDPGARPFPRITVTAVELQRLRSALAGDDVAAKEIVAARVHSADDALARPLVFPPRGGQHNQWYQCEDCQLGLVTVNDTLHRCPQCAKGYSGEPFDDVVFARVDRANLDGMRDAAWAFALTDDQRYAAHAREVLMGYAARYRDYPFHAATAAKDGTWAARSGGYLFCQTLNAAKDMTEQIAPAYDLLRASDALSPAQDEAIRVGLLAPMLASIDRNRMGQSNWQSWPNAAMLAGGGVLGERAWIVRARSDPETGYFAQMAEAPSDEGIRHENSWGNHAYTLLALTDLAEHARRLEIDLWGDGQLYPMVRVMPEFVMPDGKLPRFGGAKGLTSVLTFGPYGGSHGHFDKLSFVMYGLGTELAVNPGRARSQAYRLPIHREWYKATIAHNTVLEPLAVGSTVTVNSVAWSEGVNGIVIHVRGDERHDTITIAPDWSSVSLQSADTAVDLDEALALFTDAVERDFIRGAVLLVSQDGEVILEEALGWRDAEKQVAMETGSLFRMASNTKAITAAAVLVLVDDGKVGLDDPIHKTFPTFDHGRSSAITVRHLLTHTSGLRIKRLFISPLMSPSAEHPDAPKLPLEVARFGAVGAKVAPGTTYSYSNPGYNTLAGLVEVVSGEPFDAFVKRRIYMPLGMRDSCNHEDRADRERMSTVFRRKSEGAPLRAGWKPTDKADYPFARGSGGMITTARDFARFCQALLDGGAYGGKRFLSAELAASAVHAQAAFIPAASQYGFGWRVDPKTGVYSHGGSDGTYVFVDPRTRLIGCVLTQSPVEGLGKLRSRFQRLVTAACEEAG